MELLKELCSITALSGFEHTGSESLKDIFARYLTDCSVDPSGNVMGYLRCGKKDAPLIMLDAHLDTIGLIVRDFAGGGFVSFATLGGFDPRVLPCQEVIIHGKEDVFGVIGAKPPHILSKEELKEGVKLDDLLIDTGLSDDRMRELIKIGSPISVKTKHSMLGEDKFCGGGLDNRAGICTHLLAIEQLKSANLNADICVVASHSEEIGRFGAKIAAERLSPDLAIIVDVTHGDTPDGDKSKTCVLGKGPAVCLGPNLNRKYTSVLRKTLEENNIEYQTELETGDTGTNAWDIQVSSCGIPCVLISVPLRYMHTTIETVSLADIKSSAKGIAEFIKNVFGGSADA
ncbi:MAG: M20/M25/M40 family metallo-hydrolase [Monoglobales bacterium]